MNEQSNPQLTGDLARRHAEEYHAVRRCQAVSVGEVHLELTVGVLMVDLVNVEARSFQCVDQPLDEGPVSRQPFVIVARLVQPVGFIGRRDRYRLDAGRKA